MNPRNNTPYKRAVCFTLSVIFIFSMFPILSHAKYNAYEGNVLVNQLGYLPGADKVATVISSASEPLEWELLQADDRASVAKGKTLVLGKDAASEDELHQADFTSYSKEGSYILTVTGVGESLPFEITKNLYDQLPLDAMSYFYFNRMGIEIEAEYLSDPAYAHEGFHLGDDAIACWDGWCDDTLNVRYSWADAGDYGIYPVNHAISAWTLLNLYERYPHAFPDGSLNIPEQSNGIPDILDEVNFGSTYMGGMLPAEGLASHKVHNTNWSIFPTTTLTENDMSRFAQPPSTNATYAIARNYAHLSRLMHTFDDAAAERLWTIAVDAWSRAEANPHLSYAPAEDGIGGGDYGDSKQSDDRYAAAAELYLTAYHFADPASAALKAALQESEHYMEVGLFSWQEVAATGTLSLLSASNDLPEQDLQTMQDNLVQYADQQLLIMEDEGYPVPLSGDQTYPWGSNSFIVNKMITMGYANDITNDLKYLKAMHHAMNYILGNNPMKLSYITGYGAYAETDLHHRWAWGKYMEGIPFPKGWLSGGPNNDSNNDSATPVNNPAPKAYADMNSAPSAWASKEVTINWNAPLVWVSYYLSDHQNELSSDTQQNSNQMMFWGAIGVFLIAALWLFYRTKARASKK